MLQVPNIDDRIREFELRHPGHELSWFTVKTPDDYLALLALAPNADIKEAFGTSTAITITLAPLADGSARKSVAVDNGADLFLDALLKLKIELATGTPASDKAINIYIAGSEDGTDYTDNYTDGDAAITLRSPTNLKLAEIILTPDSGALTYPSHPISVAKTFSGVMPRKWGHIVENKTGLAFGSTEGNHVKEYSGIFATSV